MRFLNVMEYYGMRITYRNGDLNFIADYFLRFNKNVVAPVFITFKNEKKERDCFRVYLRSLNQS